MRVKLVDSEKDLNDKGEMLKKVNLKATEATEREAKQGKRKRHNIHLRNAHHTFSFWLE